jgi:hypothetical protein
MKGELADIKPANILLLLHALPPEKPHHTGTNQVGLVLSNERMLLCRRRRVIEMRLNHHLSPFTE